MQKRHDIELLRVVSAFGIVWFHAEAIGRVYSYGGLIVFLMLSTYFAGCRALSDSNHLLYRAKRLLLPWFFWFIVYGIINFFIGKSIVPIDNGIIAGVLSGPNIHLWFLPFIFVCLVTFDYVRMCFELENIGLASALLAIVILLSTPLWRFESIQLGYPYAQYAHALAGVLLGIFFSCYKSVSLNSLLLLSLLVAAIVSLYFDSGVGIPYLIGISVGCILLSHQSKMRYLKGVQIISPLMFGVYLLHPLILKSLIYFSPHLGLMLPVITFILSTIMIWLLNKYCPVIAKICT